MDKTAVAYHEAGHVVAGRVLGLDATSVSIVADSDSLGRVEGKLPEGFALDVPGAEEVMWRHVVADMAGVAAGELFAGRRTDDIRRIRGGPNTEPLIPGSDWSNMARWIVPLAGSDEAEQLATQERAWTKANRILRDNWTCVQVVAEALLEQQTLDRAALENVLEAAGCPHGEPVRELELELLYERVDQLRNQYFELSDDKSSKSEAERIEQEAERALSRIAELEALIEEEENRDDAK